MPRSKQPASDPPVTALLDELAQLRQTLAAFQTVRSPGRPEGEAWERAETTLALLQALNATLPPEQRWAVTQSLLGGHLGLNRATVKKLLAERQDVITAINQSLPLPPHRQNFGHDFAALRQALDERLRAKQREQQQAPLDAAALQQFLALLKRSQREAQIRDPLAFHLLRQIREAKGLTQKELGQVLGQPQSVIAALENGSRTLTRRMLLRYAQWLHFQ